MKRIAEMIAAAAASYPEKRAFVDLSPDPPQEVTYSGFYAASCSLARKLAESGLAPGGRVILMGRNSANWGAACLGIHLAGLTLAPLDPEIADLELKNIIAFLEPSAVICSRALARRFEGLVAFQLDLESLDFSPVPAGFDPAPLGEDQPLVIVFTSGTTSRPKGVMLSEGNLLHNILMLRGLKKLIRPEDRLLNLLPSHHVYPFTAALLTPLCAGCTIIYPRSLKGEDILSAVRGQGATIMILVPQVLAGLRGRIFSSAAEKSLPARAAFSLLVRLCSLGNRLGFRPGRFLFRAVHRNFPYLRYIACGGARLEPDIHRDLAAVGFRIIEAYGLSETSPVVTINDYTSPLPGSAGRAAPGVEVSLAGAGEGLEHGEVLVRGPNVMMGYFRLPEATAEAFDRGWFRTGDLGCLDKHGNLFLKGRLKEVIVMPSGKNIYPEELEKHYGRSKLIEEVCILSVKKGQGEQLLAVVVPSKSQMQRQRSIHIYEDLKFEIENLALEVPSYQRVTGVEFVEGPLPRTRLGKLKRFEILGLLESRRRAAGGKPSPAEEAEQTDDPLIKFIVQALKPDHLPSDSDNLELDLGLDSLSKIDFISALEQAFGLSVPEEKAGLLLTVGDLRGLLSGAAEAGGAVRGEKPARPLSELVELEESLFGSAFRFVGHFLSALLLRTLFRARVSGLEHLPREGAFIIAPNHLSYIDGVAVYGLMPYRVSRRLFSMSIPEVFASFPLSLLTFRGRIILTGTFGTAAESLDHSSRILKMGFPICIFPEGKRSLEGRVENPKSGVGKIASSCGFPLVPVHIRGTGGLLSRKNPGFRLSRIELEVLPPIAPEGGGERMLNAWLEQMRKREGHE